MFALEASLLLVGLRSLRFSLSGVVDLCCYGAFGCGQWFDRAHRFIAIMYKDIQRLCVWVPNGMSLYEPVQTCV